MELMVSKSSSFLEQYFVHTLDGHLGLSRGASARCPINHSTSNSNFLLYGNTQNVLTVYIDWV